MGMHQNVKTCTFKQAVRKKRLFFGLTDIEDIKIMLTILNPFYEELVFNRHEEILNFADSRRWNLLTNNEGEINGADRLYNLQSFFQRLSYYLVLTEIIQHRLDRLL